MWKKHLPRIHAIERFVWLIISTMGFFLFILLFTRFFIISPGTIDGPSMEPYFIDDEIIFVNKFSYLFHEPERFDVVQFIPPYEEKLIVKRIIGMPGEKVIIKRGKTYIIPVGENEQDEYVLDESEYLDEYVYTKTKGQKGAVEFELGDHEYFLMGDNRGASTDSRAYGGVPRSYLVGAVMN